MTDPLTALLDTLLPGDGTDWPAAGAQGLAARMTELAADLPGGAEALDTVLGALPDGFSGLDAAPREDILREIETNMPERFDAVVTAAYNAYYTNPAIRDVIERLSGYENRPPQPLGYTLEPFDESLLDAVKARGPIWRQVD
ncbi:hypothetical protein [Puniceibacterium sp. IMCC21224]|uniref:hypothetical protein n=1 Tax=Puniceibacterium sp. IMCC21224 TaxID=1618204 RepID=UPI00064D8A7C|nr:hypothetical protein [Puniceibacterium sp. IMCC21224]KMK64894.1 hypothetical protein IMCC21224_12139 [Puniceibacterium sp. IMCC21224]